eukprot:1822629-Alexandrium_andersonii.AAC.1
MKALGSFATVSPLRRCPVGATKAAVRSPSMTNSPAITERSAVRSACNCRPSGSGWTRATH